MKCSLAMMLLSRLSKGLFGRTLERGVVGFVIRLGRLRGWLVRLPLMLLPPSTRPTSTYLGIAILCPS